MNAIGQGARGARRLRLSHFSSKCTPLPSVSRNSFYQSSSCDTGDPGPMHLDDPKSAASTRLFRVARADRH
jgi:hypothetical protein